MEPYFQPEDALCTIAPIPVGDLISTANVTQGFPNGFITHTFNEPQTDVSIYYVGVNDDDLGRITVDGGKDDITLVVVNGCAEVDGNIVGPYIGEGIVGDVLVNITSVEPFTEVTYLNFRDEGSGVGSGDCNSVIFNDDCKFDLGNDTTFCESEPYLLDATTANATYRWQDGSTDPTFLVTETGEYWAEVTVGNCVSRDTVQVTYNQHPTVNLGRDTTLCLGDTYLLDATTPNATYLWQDGSTAPTFAVSEAGSYWVEVTTNGCSAADTVEIATEDCEALLEMPNVFTPNGDTYNDLLTPKTSKNIVSMHTQIYNRWGERVHETEHLQINWDGKGYSEGVYFWLVTYTDRWGKQQQQKGTVSLFR